MANDLINYSDKRSDMAEVFHRSFANPLITTADTPAPSTSVFNPGAVEIGNEVILLVRIEDRRGISHLQAARSPNGVDGWRWDPAPLLAPNQEDASPYEEWGCEDARITPIGRSEWVIAYTAFSRYGPAIALATTKDFHTVHRLGIIMSPNNKDCAIFPDRLEEKWLMLHRPEAGRQEHIWYATSNDLLHWSHPGVLMVERGGGWWDGAKIGAGPPPIKTSEGWLMIYHGVKFIAGGPVYRVGLALLDAQNHRNVIARTTEWVFGPEAPYERSGDAPNVVFPCGAIQRGDEIWMYYGACDAYICLATAKLSDLLRTVRELDYTQTPPPSKKV